MPVNTLNTQYAVRRPDWLRCRDTIEGERVVKGRKETYLPIPPGMRTGSNQVLENGKRTSNDRYVFYLSFAEFPELVAQAVNGFQGIIHTNEPKVELPTEMEYLLENATPDGEPLGVLWERITREILTVGRIGLLCDVKDGTDEIRIATYSAENVINWQLGPRELGGEPVFVVVREFKDAMDPEDPFRVETRVVYRELRVMDGVYQVREWESKIRETTNLTLSGDLGISHMVDESSEEPVITKDWEVPSLFGTTFKQIPITVLNVEEPGFEFGPIPILPLVRRSLSIYRKTADYNRSLYIKSDPQPVISGITKEQAPTRIGGDEVWCLPNPSARAEYLDIDGQGIPLQRQAINDEYERFYQEGGRLLDTSERSAESGEAIRRRQASNQVSLRSISQNAGQAVQFTLRKIAVLLNADPEKVKFEADQDFAEPNLEGRDLLDIMASKAQGAPLSDESIHTIMKRGSMTKLTFEEEKERLRTESRGVDGLPSVPEEQEPDERDARQSFPTGQSKEG